MKNLTHDSSKNPFEFLSTNSTNHVCNENTTCVLDFFIKHIRIISVYFVFFLTFGTLMFLSVVWIISVLTGIAIAMLLDLAINWVYVDSLLD